MVASVFGVTALWSREYDLFEGTALAILMVIFTLDPTRWERIDRLRRAIAPRLRPLLLGSAALCFVFAAIELVCFGRRLVTVAMLATGVGALIRLTMVERQQRGGLRPDAG